MLASALDAGFTHFDTAPSYGEGMAERELGFVVAGCRGKVTIGTKIGFPAVALFEALPPLLFAHRALGGVGRRVLPGLWERRARDLTPEGAETSLVHSLRSLKTDWVDMLFVHEPSAHEGPAVLGLTDWLARQKQFGRVRHIGLSGKARVCVDIDREVPGLFDILQVEDSLLLHEADAVTASGRPLQSTFGYLRQAASEQVRVGQSRVDPLGVVRSALERNACGMVLVSTRRSERLASLASLAGSV